MRIAFGLSTLLLASLLSLAACGDDGTGNGPDAAVGQPDGAAPIGAAINGTYLVTAVNGAPVPNGSGQQTWFFEDGPLHVFIDGQANSGGTYTYNDTVDPKQIDLVSNRDAVILGIYRFNDDKTVLEINGGTNGQRPTTFDFGPGIADLVEFTRQ